MTLVTDNLNNLSTFVNKKKGIILVKRVMKTARKNDVTMTTIRMATLLG